MPNNAESACETAELLAPAGDFVTALAAFDAGADAVYCGMSGFSARAFAKNFSLEDLVNTVAFARKNSKKVYVAFNTLVDEDMLDAAIRELAAIDEIGPDALIVQDIGIASIVRENFPSLALHASTQMVAHNLEGVLALGDFGFRRVVLARELSLGEIASITKRCRGIEIECFIHGALCYSVSGLCLFSAMEKGRSGNRGKCAYCCRMPYRAPSGGDIFAFSMKDLRLGEDARRLAEAGVKSLKIEGRMKSSVYVASVVKHYRDILDGKEPSVSVADLETVFSRRTTKFHFGGKPAQSVLDTENPGHLGTPIGKVKRIAKDREGRGWLRFHTSRALEKHDGIQFAAPDGGKPVGFGISEMRIAMSRDCVFEVAAGSDVELLVPDCEELAAAIREGATVYCSMSNAVRRRFPAPSFRPGEYEGVRTLDVKVELRRDRISANGISLECSLEDAKNPEKTPDAVRKAFSRLGGTGYRLGKLELDDPERLFVPASLLNELRRRMVARADEERRRAKSEKIENAKNQNP